MCSVTELIGERQVRRSFTGSIRAQLRLHQLGTGRRPQLMPAASTSIRRIWHPVLVRGRGARVEDVDGNWFVEYGMGLRSVTLGHAAVPALQGPEATGLAAYLAVADAYASGTPYESWCGRGRCWPRPSTRCRLKPV